MSNPESTSQNTQAETVDQFPFDDEFEQKLLAFLVRDIAFFRKNSHVMKASYFVSKIREDLYDKAFQYSRKYKKPIPQEALRQEIDMMYRATTLSSFSSLRKLNLEAVSSRSACF